MLRRPNMDRAPGLLDVHFTVTSLLLAHFRLAIVAYGFHIEALGSNLYLCIRWLSMSPVAIGAMLGRDILRDLL
jgi:hypothetical protein